MGTITDLSPQKRNKERINVFLDGSYAFSLTAIQAAALRVGQSLGQEKITELQFGDAVERAKQSAYRYLSYRPRSRSELTQNLQKKGFDEVVIDQAVSRLSELDLIDDMAFARYWVEQREQFSPRSRYALQIELYQKGVARHIIEEAIAEVDEEAAARRAVGDKAGRWSQRSQEDFMAKVAGFLQRRGFGYDIIANVSHDLWRDITAADNSTQESDLKEEERNE